MVEEDVVVNVKIIDQFSSVASKLRSTFENLADIANRSVRQMNNSLKGQLNGITDNFHNMASKIENSIVNVGRNNEIISKSIQEDLEDMGIMTGKTMEKIIPKVQQFPKVLRQLSQQTNLPLKSIASSLEQVNIGINKQGKMYNMLNGRLVGTKTAVTKLKGRFTRFRMELLSVMFLGMAIQRTFMGMLRPALDLVGIFDLLNITLGLVFLPIALLLLDTLLPIMDSFINLPDGIKLAIGAFALFMVAVGSALMIFGQLGLGIMGLGALFPGLAAAIAAAGGGIAGTFSVIGASMWSLLANPVGIAIIAIIAAIILLWLAWQNNWGNIRGVVANIWDFLKPVFKAIGVALNIMGKIFSEVFQIIIKIVQIAWGIISIPLNFLWGIFEGFVKALFPDVKDVWGWLWDNIIGVLQWAWGIIKPIFDLIKGALDWIINAVNNVSSAAGNIGQAIGGFVGGLIPAQHGFHGFVNKPTAFIAGEAGSERVDITPRGGVGGGGVFAPNISINVNASSDVDIDYLKRTLSDELIAELDRMLRAR